VSLIAIDLVKALRLAMSAFLTHDGRARFDFRFFDLADVPQALADVDPDGSWQLVRADKLSLLRVGIVLQCGPFGSVFVSLGVRIILRLLRHRQTWKA
jgi:hypothetical protein